MFVEFLFQTLQPFCVFVDRADIFLKDNLLGRGGADNCAEPPEVGRAPGGLARIAHIVPGRVSKVERD